MIQQKKQLILKDLCARLPYGVICKTEKGDGYLCSINQTIFGTEYGLNINPLKRDYFNDSEAEEQAIKPYLRPMSSMTEDEENEWDKLQEDPLLERMDKHTKLEDLMLLAKSQYEPTDWLLKHHFDFRGLIEKGLALEAKEGVYK